MQTAGEPSIPRHAGLLSKATSVPTVVPRQMATNTGLARSLSLQQQYRQSQALKAKALRQSMPTSLGLCAGHPALTQNLDVEYSRTMSMTRSTTPSATPSFSRQVSQEVSTSALGNFVNRSLSNSVLRLPSTSSKEPRRASKQAATGMQTQTGRAILDELKHDVDAEEVKTEESGKWLGYNGPMPNCVTELDYWDAAEFFKMYDTMRTGQLDKPQFYRMLQGICARRDFGSAENRDTMTERVSHQIFEEIDINQNGGIDKDEFMGWVFQTVNIRLNHLRDKLGKLTEEQVSKLFRQIDVSGNQALDKEEFWLLVSSIGGVPKQASDDLHEFIDVDASGEIDVDEFLNWAKPDRQIDKLLKDAKSHKGLLKADGYEAPEKPLMEVRPGKPVVLEFTVGQEYRHAINKLKMTLSQVFTKKQVAWVIIEDPFVKHTCTKVVAKVGRGIELWNHDTMMAYRDDPFQTSDGRKTKQWLADLLKQCLPDIVSAANVYRLRKRR
eukprot:TRINITY_DN28912_c0_g1_i1.p1 TRINITY_DN28912_c0_g1~~TRINITY_DN28912_c0_g1_i1.p1  ORF type:complete len:497 (+),score=100.37 TRINITY_DN28912_c0_g1_i1:130-1620(+)